MATTANLVIEGLDEALQAVQSLDRDLRTMANRELRQASKEIATDASRAIASMGRGSAQADNTARTARPKYDRFPVVRIPGVNMKLNTPKGGKSLSRARALPVAWGATGGGTAKQFAGTTNWIHANRLLLLELGLERYQSALRATLKRYGLI